MRHLLGWKAFEAYAASHLGLDTTIASGNQWHDPGDGVDRRHYTETEFSLMMDAKYTERGSFALNAAKLRQWIDRAAEAGKRFVMPLRFVDKNQQCEDYIVLRLDDFTELLNKVREEYEDVNS